MTAARRFHLLTALVATGAVVLQFVLVWQGHRVLDETDPPSRDERIANFFSYFTILSNILVGYVAWTLALGRDRDSRLWRVLSLDALVCITVTGVVHFFLLRPLLDLDGADYLADKLLHMVVPVLAVVGWLRLGPRGRVRRSYVPGALVFPLSWLAYTLVRGEITGFYPYPFLDVDDRGYAAVLATCVGVALLFLALAEGAVRVERRLSATAYQPVQGSAEEAAGGSGGA